MADDYRSAGRSKRPHGPRPEASKKDGPGKDNRKCHLCKQEGHIAINCTEVYGAAETDPSGGVTTASAGPPVSVPCTAE